MTKWKIWEYLEHLPSFWWATLGLALVLIGLVAWVQTSLEQPPPPPPRVILPPSPPPSATPNSFRPLADTAGIPLLAMTPLPKITLTPTPTPTPLFIFHTVQPGDTLISIAAQYGISTEALLAANDIRKPNKLEIGKQLLIPHNEGPRIPVVPHQVKAGDTLLKIAAKYGSSVKKILDANPGLDPDKLPVGRPIAVPVVFNEAKPVAPSDQSDAPVYYTVVEGDTPLAIAQEFDIPVEMLLAANEITDPTLLQLGDKLLIPPTEGVTQGVPIILYDLHANDTLLRLASKFGSSIKDILAVNPTLIPSQLQAGQTVAIPVVFAPPRPTPSPAQLNRPKSTPIPPPASLAEMEQQMVDAVNAERVKAGLPPYQLDKQVADTALKHAQDMVVRGFFSHNTPDGKTLRDRFAEAKINALNVGEDIQRNTRPAGEAVQFALNWFMNSRPHRANILHPDHNRIGVGIVEGPPGWYTFVLNFAQR